MSENRYNRAVIQEMIYRDVRTGKVIKLGNVNQLADQYLEILKGESKAMKDGIDVLHTSDPLRYYISQFQTDLKIFEGMRVGFTFYDDEEFLYQNEAFIYREEAEREVVQENHSNNEYLTEEYNKMAEICNNSR